MCLVLAHQSFELLDVLLFGLGYVTWALHSFFARVARLVVADGSVSQREKRRQTIKGGAYVECFRKSDFLHSECGSALGPRRAVLRSASGLEEGVASCAGIHLASLSTSEHRRALAQRCTVCTVFFKKMCVPRAAPTGSAGSRRRSRQVSRVPRFLNARMKFAPEIRKRMKGETHHASPSACAASTSASKCAQFIRRSCAALEGVVLLAKHLDSLVEFGPSAGRGLPRGDAYGPPGA
jgi:hypothetical protein